MLLHDQECSAKQNAENNNDSKYAISLIIVPRTYKIMTQNLRSHFELKSND